MNYVDKWGQYVPAEKRSDAAWEQMVARYREEEERDAVVLFLRDWADAANDELRETVLADDYDHNDLYRLVTEAKTAAALADVIERGDHRG